MAAALTPSPCLGFDTCARGTQGYMPADRALCHFHSKGKGLAGPRGQW
jgi:hypothetical protein